MKCEKCGCLLNENNACPNCSNFQNENARAETQIQNNNIENNSGLNNLNPPKTILAKLKENKLIFIIIATIILFVILIFIIEFASKNRAKTISNIEENSTLKFTIDEKDYYIGGKISDFLNNDLYYESSTSENYLESDSIALEPFYFAKKAKFLGAIYCSEEKQCSYEDSILLKANFYGKTDVIIDDFIKIGTKYDDIVEKYGQETGTFYQNSNILVWSFGKKVGDPYYLLKFDRSSIFSTNSVSEIRMGIWWYEEEFEHTVALEKEKE